MALSTMINYKVQTPAAYWKFELSLGDSESFRHDPNINYICVPTTVEFKQKIISLLKTLLVLPCQCVLVQYWASKEIGNIFVLTTTCQPFGISGNNKKLESYRKACSDHKLYVDPKKGVSFGLPGRVFLNRTPEQTQNVHSYHKDQLPPCEAAIFKKKWGCFAVPVTDNDKCVGVLEFVIATPKGSNYEKDIGIVCTALENAGFQPSTQTKLRKITNTNGRKRSRKTSSSEFTSYTRLAQDFGLSSAEAAVKLGETTGKRVKRGTFRNSCRYVQITEWPWIPKRRTTRASSDHETKVIPTASGISSFRDPVATENSYFETPTATEYMPCFSSFISSRDTTRESTLLENMMTQIAADGTNSLVNPYATEYMASDSSSFGSPVATEYIMDVGTSLSETLINQTAFDDGDAVSMQDFEEMEYQDNNEDREVDSLARRLFNFEKWNTHNIPY